MKYVCPLITVEDIERSKAFYINVMKQEILYDFGENVSFKGDFAIHLKDHYQNLIDNKAVIMKSHAFELYFEENDMEAVDAHLKANHVQFVHEMREQPWRQKVVRLYDPDGNIIEIGESLSFLCYRLHLEGKSVPEIMKTTYMTEEIVNQSIAEFSR